MVHKLQKGAFTGVAASLIEGQTLPVHNYARISVTGTSNSAISEETKKKLEAKWKDIQYFIINKMLMLSRAFLAQLSCHITVGKGMARIYGRPFGGVNILCVCS